MIKTQDIPKTEVELAQHFIDYFRDYDVYKEVPIYHGGRADIVITSGPLTACVEVKLQLSFAVIHQALHNRPYCNYSYVAVPNRVDGVKIDICRELGIGVLLYDPSFYNRFRGWGLLGRNEQAEECAVREYTAAAYRRKILRPRLIEEMKLSVAGSQHNSMSDFRVTILLLKSQLERSNGSMPVKEIFEKNRFHYSSTRSAKQCITRLVNSGVIPEFRIEKGVLILNNNENGK